MRRMASLDHRFWRRKKGGLGLSMYKGCVGLWMRLRLNEAGRDVGGYGSSWYRAKAFSDFNRVKMIRLDQPIASIRVKDRAPNSHPFPFSALTRMTDTFRLTSRLCNLIFLSNVKSAGGSIGHFDNCEVSMLGQESHWQAQTSKPAMTVLRSFR